MTKKNAGEQVREELNAIKQHFEVTGRTVIEAFNTIILMALNVQRIGRGFEPSELDKLTTQREIVVKGLTAELETIFLQVSPLILRLSQFCSTMEESSKSADAIADVAYKHPEETEALMAAHTMLKDADILLTQVKEWK